MRYIVGESPTQPCLLAYHLRHWLPRGVEDGVELDVEVFTFWRRGVEARAQVFFELKGHLCMVFELKGHVCMVFELKGHNL